MKKHFNKIWAIIILVVICLGWQAMIGGLGSIKPLKDKVKLGLDIKGGVYVLMEAQTDKKGKDLKKLMDQTRAVIESRVNQLGISEPVVTVEGEKRIRVELPGVKDSNDAIEQIGKTAQLKFLLADGTEVFDGGNVKDAVTEIDREEGGYAIGLKFDSEGARAFEEATRKAVSGKIESKIKGVSNRAIIIMLDGEPISVPNVREVISGGECKISGDFTQKEASNLSALIRGGALPLELKEVNTSVQTAKIGVDAFNKSVKAGIIGLILIFIVMIFGYRIMGVASSISLTLYTLLVIAIMGAMGSVLTLPGIAGIILSIGMAVDANVIIFTRIKEEMLTGKTPRVAVRSGYKKALSTVIDSQVTTFIAAVVLYQLGTSTVKGFAWTLMIGIIVSIFTAMLITQLYLSIIANSKFLSKLSLFGVNQKKIDTHHNHTSENIRFRFMKNRKFFYGVSVIILLLGLGFGMVKGLNYGIDFTGGTRIQVDLGKHVPLKDIKNSLKNDKVEADIIYSGKNQDQIIMVSRQSLNNDKRHEIVDNLKKNLGLKEVKVLSSSLFGPSIGDELKENALLAIVVAAVIMLIYIRIRFSRWKFGASALIGVLHDVLIVISFYAIFNIPVDNPFVAGILTVLGYSINDTIVVFDRIRENNHVMRRSHQSDIIDISINQTLSRSIMTSLTTLIVMVPLYIMTSDVIREFTLPLMVGVIAGCLSSIFVCSPIYYDICNLSLKRSKQKK